ncbi:MAG TPA: hypothetical protein VNL38_03990 [Candidatus Nitrosotenuis sp.]|nr:hypothetical protein [Candidatus Nitrosotenuis sp.]
MKAVDASALKAECSVLARYLCGTPADGYVQSKYVQAHERTSLFEPATRFDRLLLRWGTGSVLAARLVDSYACFFARRSAFRRKMILLLAILESSADDPAGLDRAGGNFWSISFFVVLRGAMFALTLLLTSLVLLPLQIALGGLGAGPSKAGHA